MNTTTTSSTPAPAPTRKTSGRLVAGLTAGALAIAGLAAGATYVATRPDTAATAAPISHTHAARAHAATGSHHAVPASTSPSGSIELLQEELGQLHYYDGPVNGYLTPSTVQAIDYLQRDAGLPQTGRLDQATLNALQAELAHGNNQMAGSGTRSHTTPAPAPTPAPTASVKLLQQQLAQLHYYNGPITGVESTSTVQAIEYLQRDAGLPQTGRLDQATTTALHTMLIHGNNQMGS